MGLFPWITRLFGQTSDILIIDGVRIPKAFTPLKDWQKKHPGEQIDGNAVRVLHEKYTFIFDKEDPEFNLFLEKCSKDTKDLRNALEAELRLRNLPFSVKAKPPATKKEIAFLIRPPFFASHEDKSDRSKSSSLMFYLHFDENHVLQNIRYLVKDSDPIPFNFFKGRFSSTLMTRKEELSSAYGDWPIFARIIVDVLELRGNTVKPLKKAA